MSVKFRVIVETLVLLIIVAVIAKQFQQPVISFVNTFGEKRLSSPITDEDGPPRGDYSYRCRTPGACGSGCNAEPGQPLPPGCSVNEQPGTTGTAVDPDVGGEQFFATPRQLNILVYFGILAGAIALWMLLLALRPVVASSIGGLPFLHFAIIFLVVLSSVMLALIKVFDAKDMMTIFSGVLGYTIGRSISRKNTKDPARSPKAKCVAPTCTPTVEPVQKEETSTENTNADAGESATEAATETEEQKTPTSKCTKAKTGKNKVVQVFIQ
jgi:hypothetical protein